MKINVQVIKSIAGSTFFKLSSAFVSFFVVPLLLRALGSNQYAIWVTLTSMIVWISLFDFGSGYSLKNKVGETITEEDRSDLQVLIAGTIQFYLLTTVLLMFVFLGSIFFVKVFRQELALTFYIYLPIIFAFPLTLGNFILQGVKKFNAISIVQFAQVFIWLLLVLLFRYDVITVSLRKLAISYSLLYFLSNLLLFVLSMRNVDFEWKKIFELSHFRSSKKSLLVGLRFFILQISSLVLYSLGNVLVYNHMSLTNVAQYDTVNKFFLITMTIFNVVISVFWTEISQAKAQKSKEKLMKLFNQLLLISLGFCCIIICASFLMPIVISLWTKRQIEVHVGQMYSFALLDCIKTFAYAGAVVLNAFENLTGQIILSIIASLLMVPLATFLFNQGVGIGTVPLASALLTFPTMVYVLFKAKKSIKHLH